MRTYVFDKTLGGLLCCIYQAFENKEFNVQVIDTTHFQPSIFQDALLVEINDLQVKRVWSGLCKKLNALFLKHFYFCYHSEKPEAWQHLFRFACYVFKNKEPVYENYSNGDVLAVTQISKSVDREKHRMEAFVRFQKLADGLFFASISPDFDVLPLIQYHFKNRYADQTWVIYDEKRKYGIHYDKHKVHEISMDFNSVDCHSSNSDNSLVPVIFDEREALYNALWKTYFGSTNIKERKNTKLHIRHIPKRYWRYLNEKQLAL